MNYFSQVAKEIVMNGLWQNSAFTIPVDCMKIAKEVFDVPEKPRNYKIYPASYRRKLNVLVTGGLDSVALYLMARMKVPNSFSKSIFNEVFPYYIDINQPYMAKEMRALRKMNIEPKILRDWDIPESGYWKHIIPARNFYFLSLIAEQMYGGGEIWFGATNGEMPERGGDKSLRFLRLVNQLFKRLPFRVIVKTPLEKMTKTDIVKWFLDTGHKEELLNTVSCFEKSKKLHCGRCQACLRKALAFINNGFELETETDIVVGCKQFINKYKRVLGDALRKNDFSHYSKRRVIQDLEAIKLLENNGKN